ncbi:Glycine--tRNA ligase beta subunit [Halioglobus japonicus]|nr:Glycine--tRNA ligase beta subunit [Halioglobus japonicus]
MKTETLLVELGTEELPPKALKSLGLAFRDGIIDGLQQRELDHGNVQWFAAPRRLAVIVEELVLEGAEKAVEVLGPPLERARDDQGNWSAAAAGFAKKQGVEPQQLEAIDTPKGQRLGLRTTVAGHNTSQELNAIIQSSIQKLPIPRRMRWGASREEFVRPVHWVVAMLGEDFDHGDILGVATGNTTQGHRFMSSGPITLNRAEDYVDALYTASVVAGFEQRREMIREQVTAQASELGATAVIDDDLLNEVTGLVEWPVALTGSFEARFLDVPAEALISSMKEHQKYFHVIDADGKLAPHFITVSNIVSTDPQQIIAGNERVIRPRLSDAAFFFETDKKVPLAERIPALDKIVFQQKLGTLLDKTERVSNLAAALALEVGADVALAQRAAQLSKTDLVTDMVLEFADMQGIAGSYYALHDGEDPEVASALAQQYWPKFAGDRLPETATACTLGLADRMDTLVGIFGIGQPPTGSKDPFALRRASLSVLRIIVDKNLPLDLQKCLDLAVAQYPEGTLKQGTAVQVLEYMIERFRAWYEEDNIPAEVFKSVSARKLSRPLDIHQRVQAVHAFTQLPEAQALAAANKRVSNILDKLDSAHSFGEVSTNLLVEPEEKALSESMQALSTSFQQYLERDEYSQALNSLASLRAPVDAFFDGVMVNAEDEALRHNRLNLLKQLRDLFLGVADISLLAVAK